MSVRGTYCKAFPDTHKLIKNEQPVKPCIDTNTNVDYTNIKNTCVIYVYKFEKLNEYEVLLAMEANRKI